MAKIVKTTGVIREQDSSNNLHIEVANLHAIYKKTVQVEVFSWVPDPDNFNLLMPQELTVIPTNQENIPPNRNAFFNADISTTDHYEVRITILNCDDDRNVAANIFERDESFGILKYILNKELTIIDPTY